MTSEVRSDWTLYQLAKAGDTCLWLGLAALRLLPPSGRDACSPGKAEEKSLTGSAVDNPKRRLEALQSIARQLKRSG